MLQIIIKDKDMEPNTFERTVVENKEGSYSLYSFSLYDKGGANVGLVKLKGVS